MKINKKIIPCILLIQSFLVYCSDNTSGIVSLGSNQIPTFNQPLKSIDYRENYIYKLNVTDPDGDDVVINITKIPDWLNYDTISKTITGIPGWENIGEHDISITAFDSIDYSFFSFSISVTMGDVKCDQYFGDPDSSLYILPYKVGSAYKIIQGYCPPNPAWGHAKSFAYDFDTAIGDTIIAARAGTIIAVKEDSEDNTGVGGANTLYIRHSDGTQMQYVHFTKNGVLVNIGDEVIQGQPIALSGNSGASSGPHVHIWLFRDATVFTKQGTMPINFRNAQGIMDSNNGLIYLERYTALPFFKKDN